MTKHKWHKVREVTGKLPEFTAEELNTLNRAGRHNDYHKKCYYIASIHSGDDASDVSDDVEKWLHSIKKEAKILLEDYE